MKMISVVVKKPGSPAELTNIDASLESMQKVVDGYIYHLPLFPHPLATYCREIEAYEPEAPPMIPNIALYGGIIMGTIFVCKSGRNGEAESLTQEQADKVIIELNRRGVRR